MSFLHGVAAFAGERLNQRIAQGMRVMRDTVEEDQGKGALLSADVDIINSWDDDLIAHVRDKGIAIPPGRWWNPRILEYYISLVCPHVYLVYFMEHRCIFIYTFLYC